MRVLVGIDPGPEQSAYVVVESDHRGILEHGIVRNGELIDRLRFRDDVTNRRWADHLAIEYMESRGGVFVMPQSAWDAQWWGGRFEEAWRGSTTHLFPRQVRVALCGTARAKPKNVRQAILDRYPATGGGKCPQVGIKSKRGPLYGITSHEWSALAVALAYLAQCGGGK